ncbi:MAG: orotidine 5'-phosphate decarboxylase [Candidatus Muproteobacteria bacterium RIFCSPHIGHO2_12_FULL_60_33]|uniref:Orotidine 5'-phosphate decarboxylase n=1 Tax=Candidatus Muproteobacteria bacterium RIFCSPLOWO2_01_FULL_60_18 TaxID=1817768 RepID=A0A1F6TYV2_9PROT|nr:MAG: orotidine 5'-phosphate decarboxylase [Candidatus Muproteobacteria bacterium RIFCSPLOWO2_01_FULL_60_18]OGI53995.1 MAG: orotidine 5'-phosphate decarboxylase [Candidatus Muproteobacteria bacterium RIFCSPHIGHO2_12_FULL_60_33]OGI59241.1 MAG: orotidine 5'-phosphate decarboxylase [Candidatus Muproteobacteria bacterium RIFCSPHIGHO2_01_FULL_61_200]
MAEPRVIVALDFAEAGTAQAFVKRVTPAQCRLKVGLELFTAAGPGLVEHLVSRGFDVFLDLKYHDIPTTVARACTQAAGLGVWMLNVHTLGGKKMLLAAREAVERSKHRPLLVGVTLLTSHGDDDLTEIGLERGTEHQVERLAGIVRDAGLNGVVCSPAEVSLLRRRFGKEFILVTPGVRQAGDNVDDQRRTRTPAEAVADGSDYLVIGRPITRAPDPVSALAAINRDIQAA